MAKSNPIPAKNNHFLHDLEYIVVIRETGAYFSANAPHKDYHKYSIVKSRTDNLHPAQKPIDVIAKYIRVLSEVGGRIADPFCGSGTTLLAARELGRKAIGAEINLEYCKMTRDRLNQMDLF